MTIVSVAGKVDKRILVLPLLRACSIDGKTVVFTDDCNLKNLYKSKSDVGSIEDIKIIFHPNIASLNESFLLDESEKYIFYIYSEYKNNNADIIIFCKSFNRTILSNAEDEEDKFPENQSEVIFSSIPVHKKSNILLLKPEHYRYLIETEEKKELLILKDKSINLLLARIMHEKVEMTKEQFYKLLNRKRIQTSVKEGVRKKDEYSGNVATYHKEW